MQIDIQKSFIFLQKTHFTIIKNFKLKTDIQNFYLKKNLKRFI